MKRLLSLFAAVFAFAFLFASLAGAATHPYDGRVTHDVKRDRIIAIAEDFSSLYYYVGPQNIDYSSYWGATCPDPTVGWKTGMKYCWGGEDTPAIYLLRLSEGDGAGNRFTRSGTSLDQFCTGTDCSGMASVCWTSPRYSTSGFPSISDDILWQNLRMGDCTNDAGSHIRIFDHYAGDANTIMFYENTSGGGLLWKDVHRSLARDDINYQPIRYHSTYKVYDYPEPIITSIRRKEVEGVEVVWDGQADVGFRLEQSVDDGVTWTRIHDTADLTPEMRQCEVSGLLPDTTTCFRMTSVNSGGETIPSNVAAVRLNGFAPRVLVVDGADRYREETGADNTFLTRIGKAIGAVGAGFDSCANEAVVDEQVDLGDYQAVVWILADESTFDETFSWPEQMFVMKYLKNGGRLFVSGSNIAYDLDYKADSTTYKNGHVNDRPFYRTYLRAAYTGDDAGTYQVTGAPGSIFDGMNFSFDDGTHGAYNVQDPDQLTAINGSRVGLNYQGGAGGVACVYGSYPSTGTIVNLGFGVEAIYPDASRNAVVQAVCNYFDMPVVAPTLKSVLKTGPTSVRVSWQGDGSLGFRVLQKTGSGSWSEIFDESTLGPEARSVDVTGLSSNQLYAFKVQAVNSAGPSADSDVMCVELKSGGTSILVVDGYDRYNSQNGGSNHTLLERFGDALTANQAKFDCCANEEVAAGTISLSTYDVVIWMCGEESDESETFSAAEQAIVQDYLDTGGKLFVSGSEIGWDLVEKGNTANDDSNGSPNDTPFYENFLKANYVADSAGLYSVTGMPGTVFEGLTFSFDDGTHGTYDVKYPDVIGANGGSVACLQYGSGSTISGVAFSGMFPGGSASGQLIYFGFPFETIYPAAARADAMQKILVYFSIPDLSATGWQCF